MEEAVEDVDMVDIDQTPLAIGILPEETVELTVAAVEAAELTRAEMATPLVTAAQEVVVELTVVVVELMEQLAQLVQTQRP